MGWCRCSASGARLDPSGKHREVTWAHAGVISKAGSSKKEELLPGSFRATMWTQWGRPREPMWTGTDASSQQSAVTPRCDSEQASEWLLSWWGLTSGSQCNPSEFLPHKIHESNKLWFYPTMFWHNLLHIVSGTLTTASSIFEFSQYSVKILERKKLSNKEKQPVSAY